MTTTQKVRHRVPTVLQQEVTECGAASLGMVLAYFGKYVPLEELRVACGVSRDGAKASSIVKAGGLYGLKIKGYKREPEQLKDMQFPLIIHWNFAHFLVVEGYDSTRWYLNDPANGPRTCEVEEFDDSFTGIVLAPAKTDDFVPGGIRPGVFTQLLKAAGERQGVALAFTLIGLLLLVPTLIVPQILSTFGDQLATGDGLGAIPAATALLVAVAIQAVVLIIQGILAVRLTSKITVRLGASMVLRLLRLPIAFHAQRGASMLSQRANVAEQLSTAISSLTISAFTASLTALASAVVLLAFDWPSGLLAIFIGTVVILVLRSVMIRSRDEAMRVVRDSMDLGSVVISSLVQIESVKASGNETGMISRGTAAQNTFMRASQRMGERAVWLSTYPMLIGGVGSISIAALATYRVANGDLSFGSFLSVQALAAGIIGPLTVIAMSLEQSQTLRASLDQVDDILNTPEDGGFTREADADRPALIAGNVDITDVCFGYNASGDPLIKDFNLSIQSGQRIALVGPSGCGKSTVSRLVTGLYEPWAGKVAFDGINRNEHAREALIDSISLVDQEISIFAGTIRDNVTLWDSSIPDSDVLEALTDAQLLDELARRPGGLDSELSEAGADLSGGQRQRLEIARALVRNPSIIVMDEATSALDPITELKIDQAIRRRGATTIVIAHRLSTIRDSDEILCLSGGVVVERGTHEDLMARQGAYAALVGSA